MRATLPIFRSIGGIVAAVILIGGFFLAPASGFAAPSVATHLNVVYGHDGGPLTLDIYEPSSITRKLPALILIHGGGWISGDKADLTSESRALAARGYVVFDIDYRLAKGQPGYPSQVNDVVAAYNWVEARGGQYDADVSRVGVIGTSAGGYLAAMLATKASIASTGHIKAVVTLSAPLDLASMVHLLVGVLPCAATAAGHCPGFDGIGSGLRAFLGCNLQQCTQALLRQASPISHVSTRTPPFFIANSTEELVVPAEQAQTMAATLRSAGVPVTLDLVPGTAHATDYLAQVAKPVVDYLAQRLDQPPGPRANPPPAPRRAAEHGSSQAERRWWRAADFLVVIAVGAGIIFGIRRRATATHQPR